MAEIAHSKIDIIQKLAGLEDTTLTRLGGLRSGNVYVNGRRTSVRLEEELWDGLKDVADRLELSQQDLLEIVLEFREPDASFTSAIRSFLITYYRKLADVQSLHGSTTERE